MPSPALDEGAVNVTPQTLYPQEGTAVPTEKEAGWSPEPVWVFWTIEKSLAPHWVSNPGPSTLQPSLYNIYATRGTLL